MMQRTCAAVVVIAAATCLTATALAHPLSTFGAQLHVTAQSVTVTINADAEPLATKLEALAGTARGFLPPIDRIASHVREIEARSHLTVDGMRVPLTASAPRFNADGQIEIGMTGSVPAGARTITWQSRLIFGTYPVSLTHGPAGVETVFWLEGQESTSPIPVAGPSGHTATLARYTALGFTHILPEGLDHILFVLGLYLLTPRLRSLVAQVSVFTLAHSLSLALGTSGLVTVPASIVEPLIALSIAYVGVENLFRSELTTRRLWLVGAFGLLHGLGFAGVLADLSLPQSQWLTALGGFNLGVECGQLTVILTTVALVRASTRWVPVPVLHLRRHASAAIAAMGVFWVISRI